MQRQKSESKLRSASESQIASMVAKMFGVKPDELLTSVFDQINDTHDNAFPELRHDFRLYPWECPLPTYVMSDKVNTLIEDLVGSDGFPYIVKDSNGIGRSGLWVVRASFSDDPPPVMPVRVLINHFLIGEEWLRVTAYQLETCLRNLKLNLKI